MHERAAVSAALGALLDQSGGSVSRVVAAVGTGVDRAVVEGIWQETVAGTQAADATLVIESALDVLRCLGCGSDYSGGKLDQCPECGGDGLVIDTAPEFEVLEWESTR